MDEATILTLEALQGPVVPGANLLENRFGATFRTWAPTARRVRVRWGYTQGESGDWHHQQEAGLQRFDDGSWAGFAAGLQHGERYMFHVTGPEGGGENIKRDPCARIIPRVTLSCRMMPGYKTTKGMLHGCKRPVTR